MELYFVLDERGDPVPERDVEVWARWYERADRGVARSAVYRDVTVLTMFNGVGEVPSEDAEPRLFESQVFGGVLDGEVLQTRTRAEAMEAHERLVYWCRVGNAPGCGVTAADVS
jgi:hypothetical protein